MQISKKKSLIIISTIIALFSSFWFVINIDVSTRQGVNYVVNERTIPLYIKTFNFFHRHFEHKRLTKDIIRGSEADEEKVLAIFDWTVKNIKKVPSGMPIIDDHVLNIIIRGYGTSDQSADVFTTLCVYAGIPAAMYKISPKNSDTYTVISIVNLRGRNLVFDTYLGNYFRNTKGQIASIRDIIETPSLVSQAKNQPIIKGIAYTKYYEGLKPIKEFQTPRGELQMPLRRLVYEIRRKFGLT
ncbi:MAG: transglutaminase domain-containing protein [Desulfobacterales bacterium]|jgi:hypothetical protein|nr:transglutaminase domain-containing protein [Desulfobacterales bacterium]